MARPRDPSWLLATNPPSGKAVGERGLWWAIIRQGAHDLRYSHQSEALDALEFLRSTGLYLATTLFGSGERAYQEEIVRLIMKREQALGVRLHVEQLDLPRKRK